METATVGVSISQEEYARLKRCEALLETVADNLHYALENAPERPGHTCPQIDEVIKTANRACAEIREAQRLLRREGLDDPFSYLTTYDLSEVEDQMEVLRSANDALRTNGTYLYKAIKECLEIIDKAQ